MVTINNKAYRELRCNGCRKFVLYEYIYAGRAAFQCPRCGHLNEYEFKYLPTKSNKQEIETEFSTKGGENNGWRYKSQSWCL